MSELFVDLSNVAEGGARVDLKAYAGTKYTRSTRTHKLDHPVATTHHVLVVKATQGIGFRDPSFPGWWAAARQAGIPHRGAYLFSEFENYTAQQHADTFLHYVLGQGIYRQHDFPVIDCEQYPGNSASTLTARRAMACCRIVQGHWRAGWIYANSAFAAALVAAGFQLPPGWSWWLADYAAKLWIPHGINSRNVAAWQRTDGVNGTGPHRLPGMSFVSDISELRMRGSLQLRFGK